MEKIRAIQARIRGKTAPWNGPIGRRKTCCVNHSQQLADSAGIRGEESARRNGIFPEMSTIVSRLATPCYPRPLNHWITISEAWREMCGNAAKTHPKQSRMLTYPRPCTGQNKRCTRGRGSIPSSSGMVDRVFKCDFCSHGFFVFSGGKVRNMKDGGTRTSESWRKTRP